MDLPAASPTTVHSRSKGVLLAAGILLIAFNLRPSIAAIGPLATAIREAMGLSNAMLGLLTTLPLLAFGALSILIPGITRRYGMASVLAGALAVLAAGIALRSVASVATLFTGTLLLGIAIAFCNVLLPVAVKQGFPRRAGLMTGLYSGMMGVGAALAAGISVPLAQDLPSGWRGALAVWALPAVLALLLWLPQVKRMRPVEAAQTASGGMGRLMRSRLAWNVALFMGLQSFTFYVVLAWLPDILQSRGTGAVEAGWMLSLSQVTSFIGSLAVPIWAAKRPGQRVIMLVLVGLELLALIGLAFPVPGPVEIWVSLIGLGLGCTFSLTLYLIVVRTADAATATGLSGMAQAIGYLLAAAGPIVAGSLFDLTGQWFYVLALLIVLEGIKLYAGLGAARAEVVSVS